MTLNPPTYTDVRDFLGSPKQTPWEVRDLRISSRDVYRYLGTPVLLKKMYTIEDVNNGVAQEAPSFDYIFDQSTYANDAVSHGVGFVSIETQPGEWLGIAPDSDPALPTIVEADSPPYPNFVPAPKYRGYGPGFLTYAILPDRPEDQWKLTEQGALTRTQTATVQLPWWPYVGDNDLLIAVSLDQQSRIVETYDRYQLKQMAPITMHGIDRGGQREFGPLSANNNRYLIGFAGEVTKVPPYDQTLLSVEVDR